MEFVHIVLVVVGFLIVLGILLFLLWEQITNVKPVRMTALAIAGVIKLFSPLVGGVFEKIVKTLIWF